MDGTGRGLLVGVTGGIGSGKTTLCRILSELGRVVLSADEIAKQLTVNDPEIRSTLAHTFGPTFFFNDGSLDRKKLAAFVFESSHRLRKLNSILHPRVIVSIKETLRTLPPKKRRPYVAIEAALVYEAGLESLFNYIVVVDAPVDTRIQRLMVRDGASKSEILKRMRSQFPFTRKAKKADFVVVNQGSEEKLRKKVGFLDQILGALTNTEKRE